MARAYVTISGRDTVDRFVGNVNAVIGKMGHGTKKLAQEAADWIYAESLDQVPRDTGTLAASAYQDVRKASNWGYEAEVGYGGNGDPYNYRHSSFSSEYMLIVHEDLTKMHPNGGKAKFLEDPINTYMYENFPRSATTYVREVERGVMK